MGTDGGALGETQFCIADFLPNLTPGARTAQGSTMVAPGPLVVSLLLPSLTLLVARLSSSHDVSREPGSEQHVCALREHPTVTFEGESTPLSGP